MMSTTLLLAVSGAAAFAPSVIHRPAARHQSRQAAASMDANKCAVWVVGCGVPKRGMGWYAVTGKAAADRTRPT